MILVQNSSQFISSKWEALSTPSRVVVVVAALAVTLFGIMQIVQALKPRVWAWIEKAITPQPIQRTPEQQAAKDAEWRAACELLKK